MENSLADVARTVLCGDRALLLSGVDFLFLWSWCVHA